MNQKKIGKKISRGIVYGLLLIMLFSNVANAAHTLDNSSVRITTTGAWTATNPANISYTVGAGSTVMVLGIVVNVSTFRTVGTPTFRGKSFTQIARNVAAASPETAQEMWYLLLDSSDAGVTANVTVPNNAPSQGIETYVFTFKSATGASALDTFSNTTATGTNVNGSVTTTVAGDAIVTLLGSGATTSTATFSSGTTTYTNDPGTYFGKIGYKINTSTGKNYTNLTLSASEDWGLIIGAFKEVGSLYNISGYITDKSSGSGLNNTTVRINSTPVKTTNTNATGYYNFSGLKNDTYFINASLSGYITNSTIRIINGADITDADIQLSQVYLPPTPISLTSNQANFWINYSWLPGSGFFTDSYNVSVNNIWNNGTTQTFNLTTVGAHGWSNISVYAFNNSGAGNLNLTPAVLNTQLANNVPVQTLADTFAITAGNMLIFTVSATDADSDPLIFSTNATNGSLNQSTGVYSWMPSSADTGSYFWFFRSNDSYSGIATNTTMITVSDTSGTYINGTVRSGVNAVEGVRVSTNTSINTTTDAYGFYSLPVTAEAYELTAAKEPVYYANSSVAVTAISGAVVVQDIDLLIKPTGNITGSVTNV